MEHRDDNVSDVRDDNVSDISDVSEDARQNPPLNPPQEPDLAFGDSCTRFLEMATEADPSAALIVTGAAAPYLDKMRLTLLQGVVDLLKESQNMAKMNMNQQPNQQRQPPPLQEVTAPTQSVNLLHPVGENGKPVALKLPSYGFINRAIVAIPLDLGLGKFLSSQQVNEHLNEPAKYKTELSKGSLT